MNPSRPNIAALVKERDMLVCVGTGGVGKTTLAAALALGAAHHGLRALVVTIDPARRLADALGIDDLPNEPREIAIEQPATEPAGQLFAMMLDPKKTFDDMVARFSESPEAKERILSNPIYQHLSSALAGSSEYAAMEKVFELHESAKFDIIIVDTPPSQHALDFIDTPRRLAGFRESRLAQLLIRPALGVGGFGLRIFARSGRRALGLLENVSGVQFLRDISEFLVAFESMATGFLARAEQVEKQLRSRRTGFLLVAAPGVQTAERAARLLAQLETAQLPVAGLVLNRMHHWPDGGRPPERLLEPNDLGEAERLLGNALGSDGDRAAKAAIAMARGYASVVRQDHRTTKTLRAQAQLRGLFVKCISEFEQEVHDLSGLGPLHRCLFEEEDQEACSYASS